MHTHAITAVALACAILVLIAHPRVEGFPFLLLAAAGAAGAGGAGGISWMRSGALWSKGARPPNAVSFYKDGDLKGPRRDFLTGTLQKSLSKGKFGLGRDKENDTYSSVQVPPGMYVHAYEHNDFKGQYWGFGPGNHNLAQYGAEDKISSFKIEGTASVDPATAACQKAASGSADYSLRIANPGKNPYWVCPPGSTDTGCSWGMGADYEKRQCRRN